jgi:hypothetical protein
VYVRPPLAVDDVPSQDLHSDLAADRVNGAAVLMP